MKCFLLVAAIAVMAAPFAPARAAECKTDPKAYIKHVEESLKAQQAKLDKGQVRAAGAAINKAKMAAKFGNMDTACESLEPVKATLGLKP